ncbi:MAG: hypothetical protein U1F50_10120, partial [Rubrivivax sp.]
MKKKMLDALRSTFATAALTAVVSLLGACATAPAPLSGERIAAIVASPDRTAADRDNDVRRKPGRLLAFIGVR